MDEASESSMDDGEEDIESDIRKTISLVTDLLSGVANRTISPSDMVKSLNIGRSTMQGVLRQATQNDDPANTLSKGFEEDILEMLQQRGFKTAKMSPTHGETAICLWLEGQDVYDSESNPTGYIVGQNCNKKGSGGGTEEEAKYSKKKGIEDHESYFITTTSRKNDQIPR